MLIEREIHKKEYKNIYPAYGNSGIAPQSDEKIKLVSECFQELIRAIKTKQIQDEDCKKLLITAWLKGYKKLPNYKTREEVDRMDDIDDIRGLKELGIYDYRPKQDEPAETINENDIISDMV